MSEPTISLLEFPCPFAIKAMGKMDVEFDLLVLELVGRHVTEISKDAIKLRPSKAGNYLAVTITITATSQQQLDAIYQDLSGHPQVLMVL